MADWKIAETERFLDAAQREEDADIMAAIANLVQACWLMHDRIKQIEASSRPSANRSPQEIDQAYVQGLRDRFYRTGSMEDAAELMKYLAD